MKGSAEAKKEKSVEPVAAESAAKPSAGGKKNSRSLDDLLGEVGSKKTGDDGSKAKSTPEVTLVNLSQGDIVTAMKAVQPRVQACANQFKVPGTAMATLSVAKGGRVSSVSVTGNFAGSPTGTCVENAAKSAHFPPCQSMTFPWPFTLSPR
jgi:hypothetical protein